MGLATSDRLPQSPNKVGIATDIPKLHQNSSINYMPAPRKEKRLRGESKDGRGGESTLN